MASMDRRRNDRPSLGNWGCTVWWTAPVQLRGMHRPKAWPLEHHPSCSYITGKATNCP